MTAEATEMTKKSEYSYQGRRTDVRFLDCAHLKLVQRAARKAGQSVNGWMVSVLLEAARGILGAK